jgi:hypothetical protein
MDDQEHIQSVVFVIGFLMDSHPRQSDTSASDIERAVAVASVLSPSVDVALLRRDVEFVLEMRGTDLFDRRNRGRRDEIIRGALR